MANDHVKMFAEEYGPIAVQVSKQTGIAPSVLLAQWGMETDYGRRVPGHFNFGNIKDFSGAGTQATDNKTKSVDKYLNFESPEAFGDYYAHMMRRLYPNALNTGTDISKYTEGLNTGIKGSYFEDSLPDYENKVRGAHNVTTNVYTDPEKIDVVRPPTQAEQIKSEREERGDAEETTTPAKTEVVNPYVASGVAAAANLPNVYPAKEAENLQKAKDAVELAKINLEKSLPENTSYKALEAEFRNRQQILENAKNEFDLAKKMSEAPSSMVAAEPSAPTAVTQTSEPSIITDPNVPTNDQHTRAIQGTTVDGVTGRARQTTYQERTSQIARNAANQKLVLQALGQQGLIDPNKAYALTEGISGSTPSGVSVTPDLAGEIQNEADLKQRIENDKIEQKKLEQQAAAKKFQETNQAMKTARPAQAAATRAETAEEMARRQLSRAKVVPSVSSALAGGLGGLQAARGINELANMPIDDLIARYNAGERSPELLEAIKKVAFAGAQTGLGAAAALPAFNAPSKKITRAGTLGTLGLGGYQLYKEFTEPEKN